MRKILRTVAGLAVVGAVMPAFMSAAAAAPVNAPSAMPITLTCDNGVTYSAVVNGGGSDHSNSGQTYNPAHSVTDNTVLLPVAFGESTFSLYVNGQLVDQETQPPAAKGNAGVPANATPVHCTYSFESSQTDPTTGDVYAFRGTGSVTGFIPGAGSRS